MTTQENELKNLNHELNSLHKQFVLFSKHVLKAIEELKKTGTEGKVKSKSIRLITNTRGFLRILDNFKALFNYLEKDLKLDKEVETEVSQVHNELDKWIKEIGLGSFAHGTCRRMIDINDRYMKNRFDQDIERIKRKLETTSKIEAARYIMEEHIREYIALFSVNSNSLLKSWEEIDYIDTRVILAYLKAIHNHLESICKKLVRIEKHQKDIDGWLKELWKLLNKDLKKAKGLSKDIEKGL